jgi:hypothetical protein
MRLNKIVTELVHKYLVACIDCAPGYNLAAVKNATWKNVEIMSERFGGSVYKEVLPLADQPRKSEKEEDFLWYNLKKLIVFTRDRVNVIATQNNELADLLQNVGSRFCAGVSNDSIQGRLHRAGGNFEWLQEIGANAYGYNNRHQNHLAILSPMRFPSHWSQPVQ